MRIKSMRRLAILLTIGILWLGGLHPDFAVANDHIGFQGQVKSLCNSEHPGDDGCLFHSNQPEIANFIFDNFEKPFAKKFISLNSSSAFYRHRAIWMPERSTLNKGIKLTGTVIKRE